MNASPHPIDFDAYGRGDLIPLEEIKVAAVADGVDVENEAAIRFYCLNLKQQVQKHLILRGVGLASIRLEAGGLRILKDGDDQSLYCENDTNKALRRLVRRYREMAAVDVSLLSDDRVKRHQELLVRTSRMIGESGYPRSRLPELPKIEDDSPPE